MSIRVCAIKDIECHKCGNGLCQLEKSAENNRADALTGSQWKCPDCGNGPQFNHRGCIIKWANQCGIDTDEDGDIFGSTNGALLKFADLMMTHCQCSASQPAQTDARVGLTDGTGWATLEAVEWCIAHGNCGPRTRATLVAIRALLAGHPGQPKPIDMLLFCPKCGTQHIDAPEKASEGRPVLYADTWTNPPHRSHLCHACGTVWRPADVPTNGVATIQTRGKADTWDGQQEPRAEVTDTARLDWLCEHVVNVRHPLMYGSRDMFWASPTDDDGGHTPSDLRAKIDAARTGASS